MDPKQLIYFFHIVYEANKETHILEKYAMQCLFVVMKRILLYSNNILKILIKFLANVFLWLSNFCTNLLKTKQI